MKHLELGFIGFGLIGGSIARAFRKKQLDVSITVYSRRKNPDLEQGVSDGVIDRIVYAIDDSFSHSDVIFLCAPVLKNPEFLSLLKDIISPDCILTDVGSVKNNICREARRLGLASRFIGGHPMAGSEKTGYANSTDTLLENAYYLLTPSEENKPEDVDFLRTLVSYTDASCVIISPQEHDRITAAISHVPHIIAAALVQMVHNNDNSEENMKAFAAGGFKDITRIASSSPDMWRDICIANGDSINHFLSSFQEQLACFQTWIREDRKQEIEDEFRNAGDYRNSIPAKRSTLIERSYDMFISIEDNAGAIAAIATLLSEHNISIKNIGILHNREYMDGVLKLELYNEKDAGLARRLLEEKNYAIVVHS